MATKLEFELPQGWIVLNPQLKLLTVLDGEAYEFTHLDMEEAKALRDWLIEVLPNDH